MSQLTSQTPPAATDEAAAMTHSAPSSPDRYARRRIWARIRRVVQDMSFPPDYPGELHIRWP